MYRDNFENITNEMLDILTFWLNEGADGFRLHATERLFESGAFTRETPIDPNGDLMSYGNYENIYSKNYVSYIKRS
jgi:glycosidase